MGRETIQQTRQIHSPFQNGKGRKTTLIPRIKAGYLQHTRLPTPNPREIHGNKKNPENGTLLDERGNPPMTDSTYRDILGKKGLPERLRREREASIRRVILMSVDHFA